MTEQHENREQRDRIGRYPSRLDALGIHRAPVISAGRGRMIALHDPDGHELSSYAETHHDGVRPHAVRTVRSVGASRAAPTKTPGGFNS